MPLKPRENPFRVERLESLAFRPQGTNWPSLLVRLDQLGFRAAIVGRDGSGKTTFLHELARRLAVIGVRPMLCAVRPDSSRDAVRETLARARDARASDIVLVDGADHLRRLAWMRLQHAARHARGLVVTSHRVGLLPTLIESRTSAELLRDLVHELAPDRVEALSPALAPLLTRHDGNIRTALLEIFDIVAANAR